MQLHEVAEPEAPNKPSVAVAIVGMHRSGTSAVAGALRHSGLYLGRVLDKGFEHNPTGLQEPEAVLYMHEDLFRKNGGSWSAPPTQTLRWDPLHKAVRDLFIETRQSEPLWGFKDPRTLFALEGWLAAEPELRPIGVFRHPLEVAKSLEKRNGMALPTGLWLWSLYNERLLHWHERLGFSLLNFNDPTEKFLERLDEVGHGMGLEKPSASGVIDPAIRRNAADEDASLPAEIQKLYDALRDRAV